MFAICLKKTNARLIFQPGSKNVCTSTRLFVVMTSNTRINFSLSRYDHGVLSQNLLFHNHIAFIIELSFMPESTVWQVIFTCSRAHRHLLGCSLVMSSSLISAGLRGFSFRIWHNLNFIYFNFFNFSHRGSIVSLTSSSSEVL
jgi:hypothetical protein